MTVSKSKEDTLVSVLNDVLPRHHIKGDDLSATILEVQAEAMNRHLLDSYTTHTFLKKTARKKAITVAEGLASSVLASVGMLLTAKLIFLMIS